MVAEPVFVGETLALTASDADAVRDGEAVALVLAITELVLLRDALVVTVADAVAVRAELLDAEPLAAAVVVQEGVKPIFVIVGEGDADAE